MSGIRPEPPGRGRAVKAVAHVHSEWSDDASWPLSRIAATFSRRGYHVVLMSEHSRGFTAAKWDDYRQAMDREQRVLIRIAIERVGPQSQG